MLQDGESEEWPRDKHAEQRVDLEGIEDQEACPDRVLLRISLEVKLSLISFLRSIDLLLHKFLPAVATAIGRGLFSSGFFLIPLR